MGRGNVTCNQNQGSCSPKVRVGRKGEEEDVQVTIVDTAQDSNPRQSLSAVCSWDRPSLRQWHRLSAAVRKTDVGVKLPWVWAGY